MSRPTVTTGEGSGKEGRWVTRNRLTSPTELLGSSGIRDDLDDDDDDDGGMCDVPGVLFSARSYTGSRMWRLGKMVG